MGEAPEDDDAPTDYAPTELGAAIDETEAHKAWALADEPDELPRTAPPGDDEPDESPRSFTPQRITALAVAGSLVLVGVAAGISVWHLRSEPAPRLAEPAPAVLDGVYRLEFDYSKTRRNGASDPE